MMNFKVTLLHMDNPDKLKFVIVEECKDMDDCLNHIWETELAQLRTTQQKGWVIDAVKRI